MFKQLKMNDECIAELSMIKARSRCDQLERALSFRTLDLPQQARADMYIKVKLGMILSAPMLLSTPSPIPQLCCLCACGILILLMLEPAKC